MRYASKEDWPPMELLHRSSSDIIADDEGNTVVVQLAQYGDVREVSDGGPRYRETFRSMHLSDRVHVLDAHGGKVIGHADVTSWRADPQPTVDVKIADTSAGRDLLALVRNGTIGNVSVEFAPSPTDKLVDGVMVRENALVGGIAFAFRPAHNAPILATREDPTPKDEPIMADTATPEITVDAVTREDLNLAVDDLKREMVSFNTTSSNVDEFSRLREFPNLATAAIAAFEDPEMNSLLRRVLADQTTTTAAGLIQKGWLNEVFGIINLGRRSISAFGTAALPQTGMSVDFPYLDTLDLTCLLYTSPSPRDRS